MKKVKGIYKAAYEPIGDLITYRVMPTESVEMNQIDPFIFLNHHGYQEYLPHNRGLPFGPHPHRGFETVTFILEGDLMHKDSGGGASVINKGGVQWMTAGSGLIHAEISSDEFKSKGGPLEILQLWINLPAKYKMEKPKYIGLQQEQIPAIVSEDGKTTVNVVSGNWQGTEGAIKPLSNITLGSVFFKEGGKLALNIPQDQNIFFYVVKGEVIVNGEAACIHHLVEFEREGEEIEVLATTDAIILLGHAVPFNEPLVAYGPFVMNTAEEIQQAYKDYRAGLFGDEDAF